MKTKPMFAAISFGVVVFGQASTAFGLDIQPSIQCPQIDTRKTQLCLALDGSGSISGDNYNKIKKAVADAIRSASTVPQNGSVAISVVQFSSDARVVVPSTVIDSATAADQAASLVENMQQPGDSTAIGKAIEACSSQFSFMAGTRHVIDVFTDGASNTGIAPSEASVAAIAGGVNVVNALLVGGIDWSQVVGTDSRKGFVWPESSPRQSSTYSVFPRDGFAIYLKDFTTFSQTFAAMIRTETLTITSSDPGSAIRVMGTVDQQVAALNSTPPAYSTAWRSVFRKQGVPALKAFKCGEVADPLDRSGVLGLAYVSANTYLKGVDEVTYDNCNSAFYRFTFSLPKGLKEACVVGNINVDDAGVAYLNGGRISPAIGKDDVDRDRADSQGKPALTWPTQDQFGTSSRALFKEGVNELVFGVAGDLSVWEPTGLEFKATVIAKAAPYVTLFKINNDANSTAVRTVTLNNSASERPTHYMASESSQFTGATWQSYGTAPTFNLYSGGAGVKTIYFKTKGVNGESNVVKDTITFTGS
ncbi:MAG: DUF1194 domain-containing protein [Candidatus Contendobacter sp.]|nr:DUF1194 domain-containing protein [Candidatus Contendobacter sp.]